MQGFGTIAQPLIACLKSTSNFKWSKEVDLAFQKLKQVLVFTPMLALPDFLLEFMIEINALGA